MRHFTVSAFFPNLRPAHLAYQRQSVDAESLEKAIVLALTQIRALPALHGKHMTEVTLTAVEVKVAAPAPVQ